MLVVICDEKNRSRGLYGFCSLSTHSQYIDESCRKVPMRKHFPFKLTLAGALAVFGVFLIKKHAHNNSHKDRFSDGLGITTMRDVD